MNRTTAWLSCIALVAAAFTLPAGAQVTGKVTLDGKAPAPKQIDRAKLTDDCKAAHKDPIVDESIVVGAKGELKYVVVSIKNPPESTVKPATGKVVLDQKGCTYTPHVVGLQVGQTLVARNSDPILHNVHGLPEENDPFNKATLAGAADLKLSAPKSAEIFRVKCDIHPWMGAWVAVFAHPFFAITGEDGAFCIPTLPDGEYEVQAWQEKLGTVDGKVTVKGGKGEVNLVFKAE